MSADNQIPEPVLFNPLKHHLGFIRDFANMRSGHEMNGSDNDLIRELKHLGTSVTDVYSGTLKLDEICSEVLYFLSENKLYDRKTFSAWTGPKRNDYKVIALADKSEWTIKYHNNIPRFVHIFPARVSLHTFRVKSNTLKSALLYNIKVGKDYITVNDLNSVRSMLGLSPVKDAGDPEAIVEMIEILRNSEELILRQ